MTAVRPRRLRLSNPAVVCALLLMPTALAVAQSGKPPVHADILVLPDATLPSTVSPSDLRVSVGSKTYAVDSVGKATALKKVVVFDFASIAFQEDVPCLASQMQAFASDRRHEDIDVIALWVPSNDYRFNYEDRVYVLQDQQPDPQAVCESPENTTSTNSGGRKNENESKADREGLARTLSVDGGALDIPSVLNALWRQEGPYQLAWVGQGFGWEERRVKIWPYPDPGPNPATRWMSYITSLGLAVFPVVWAPQDPTEEVQKRRVSLAEKVASYLGGEVSECQGNIAPCLDKVFERGASGWIMRVSGPPVSDPNFGFPPEIQAWFGLANAKRFVKRPFSVPVSQSQPFPNALRFPSAAGTPLESVGLDARIGCHPDPDGHTPSRGITLLIPRDVVQRGGPHLNLYTSPLKSPETPTDTKGFKTRAVVDAVLDSRGDGPAEVCVVLPPANQMSVEFAIVVFNPAIHWAGKARIADTRKELPFQR